MKYKNANLELIVVLSQRSMHVIKRNYYCVYHNIHIAKENLLYQK